MLTVPEMVPGQISRTAHSASGKYRQIQPQYWPKVASSFPLRQGLAEFLGMVE